MNPGSGDWGSESSGHQLICLDSVTRILSAKSCRFKWWILQWKENHSLVTESQLWVRKKKGERDHYQLFIRERKRRVCVRERKSEEYEVNIEKECYFILKQNCTLRTPTTIFQLWICKMFLSLHKKPIYAHQNCPKKRKLREILTIICSCIFLRFYVNLWQTKQNQKISHHLWHWICPNIFAVKFVSDFSISRLFDKSLKRAVKMWTTWLDSFQYENVKSKLTKQS